MVGVGLGPSVSVGVSQCNCGSQRTALWSRFSLSTFTSTGIPEIEVRPRDLYRRHFIYCTHLPAMNQVFSKVSYWNDESGTLRGMWFQSLILAAELPVSMIIATISGSFRSLGQYRHTNSWAQNTFLETFEVMKCAIFAFLFCKWYPVRYIMSWGLQQHLILGVNVALMSLPLMPHTLPTSLCSHPHSVWMVQTQAYKQKHTCTDTQTRVEAGHTLEWHHLEIRHKNILA